MARRLFAWWIGCVGLLLSSPVRADSPGEQASCNQVTYSYTESFSSANIDKNKAQSSGVTDNANSFLTLNRRGGGFSNAAVRKYINYQDSATHRLQAVVAANFNNDSGRIDDLMVLNAPPTQLVAFPGLGGGNFGAPVSLGFFSAQYNLNLISGDIDGDGVPDVVYAGMKTPTSYLVDDAKAILKPMLAAQTLSITSALQGDQVGWHIGGSQLALTDFDGDGRADLFALSSYGTMSRVLLYKSQVSGVPFVGPGQVLLADAGLQYPIAGSNTGFPVSYRCMPDAQVSAGGTVLVPADFNNDGLIDLVTGSQTENVLHYFQQTSSGGFRQLQDISLKGGGPLFAFARDMDNDGTTDLVYFQSGNACGGPPAAGWIVYNDNHGLLNFSQINFPFEHSLSFATVINYDNDADGTVDLLAGRHNIKGRHLVYLNSVAPNLYNLNGVATSVPVASYPGYDDIVDVVLKTFDPAISQPLGTQVTLQMSNDNGANWEELSPREYPPNAQPHNFTHFGHQLRWRTLLSATAVPQSFGDQIYSPAAVSTPKVSTLSFDYDVLTNQVYSRSSPASARLGTPTSPLDFIYSASYVFPGYLGDLIGFNVSQVSATSASTGSLQTLVGSAADYNEVNASLGVGYQWDAQGSLTPRSGASRVAYLVAPTQPNLPLNSATDGLTYLTQRLTATDQKMKSVGAQNANVAARLGEAVGPSYTQAGLLSYIMAGLDYGPPGAGYKLRDPGHASPVVVSKPSGDPAYLDILYQDGGYANFVKQNASRKPVVYQGVNDGMLHAFDAINGDELWGLVPFNTFNRFSNQGQGITGAFSYTHQISVDGTPTIADVRDASGRWHTLLISGQGQGVGMGGSGFYYALDVTDPLNPLPLWEFSDVLSTRHTPCQINNNTSTTCTPSCTTDPSSCYLECQQYDSYFGVGSTGGSIDQYIYDDCYQITPFSCSDVYYSFYVDHDATYYLYAYNQPVDPSSRSTQIINEIDNLYTVSATMHPGARSDWYFLGAIFLEQGEHTAVLRTRGGSGIYFGRSAVQTTPTVPTSYSNTCLTSCSQTCYPNCQTTTLDPNAAVAWPQCGQGVNQQCCGAVGTDQYCAPVGTCNSPPEGSQGQSFSRPAVGLLRTSTGGVWAAFFGSGYDGRGTANVGRGIYAVNALTGALLARWQVDDIPGPTGSNPSNIDNTIPGSISLVDIDSDGYVDRAYFGDLEGRLWKIDLSRTYAPQPPGSPILPNGPGTYPLCALFDAGLPNQSGSRIWAPIVTKPGVAAIDPNFPNVYFGTGGDDRAPNTSAYKFYSIRDDDLTGSCRSIPKTEGALSPQKLEWVVSGSPGEHFWADPLIVNNNSVYFSSLPGSADAPNPCQGGVRSKVYAYALQNFYDASGNLRRSGMTLLDNNNPFLLTIGKVRSSAMVRGGNPDGPSRGGLLPAAQGKSDVFFQSLSGKNAVGRPPIERLSTVGSLPVQTPLKVVRWREVIAP
jgi:hypothetical protein